MADRGVPAVSADGPVGPEGIHTSQVTAVARDRREAQIAQVRNVVCAAVAVPSRVPGLRPCPRAGRQPIGCQDVAVEAEVTWCRVSAWSRLVSGHRWGLYRWPVAVGVMSVTVAGLEAVLGWFGSTMGIAVGLGCLWFLPGPRVGAGFDDDGAIARGWVLRRSVRGRRSTSFASGWCRERSRRAGSPVWLRCRESTSSACSVGSGNR